MPKSQIRCRLVFIVSTIVFLVSQDFAAFQVKLAHVHPKGLVLVEEC